MARRGIACLHFISLCVYLHNNNMRVCAISGRGTWAGPGLEVRTCLSWPRGPWPVRRRGCGLLTYFFDHIRHKHIIFCSSAPWPASSSQTLRCGPYLYPVPYIHIYNYDLALAFPATRELKILNRAK